MYFTGFFVILLIILLFFISIQRLKDGEDGKSCVNFPPGPKPLPLIGNLLLMDFKRPQKTYMQLSKIYGSIFSIQLGMKKVVVLSGYETVKDALVNHADEFAERPDTPILKDIYQGVGKHFLLKLQEVVEGLLAKHQKFEIFGDFNIHLNDPLDKDGITFAHGESWRTMRRFTLTTLRDFGMGKRTIEDKITEESQFLIENFQSRAGKPFDASRIISAAVANIITSIVLGHRFDYDHPTLLMLTKLVTENFQLLGSPMVNLYNLYPALEFLPGSHKTILRNKSDIVSFLRKTFLKSHKELNCDDKRNFIDAFIVKEKEEKNNPTSYFHESSLISVVITLFSAGIDTTSSTLRWGLALMLKYPEIQKKVQEEIEAVIGSEQPTIAHRKLMPYTDAVIHEVQRFGNIMPMSLPRETTVDTTFRGYFIPKGTHIIPLLESVHYDKTQFEKPEEFYPQHFLDSEGKFMKKDALMNFGACRRVCIGENLARMELFVFFTSLLQKFTLGLPPGVPDIDLTPDIGFTTPPVPYQLCAIPRS